MLRDRGNFSLPILLHVKSLNIRMRTGLKNHFFFDSPQAFLSPGSEELILNFAISRSCLSTSWSSFDILSCKRMIYYSDNWLIVNERVHERSRVLSDTPGLSVTIRDY